MGESVQNKMLASRNRYQEDKAKSIGNAYRRKLSVPSQNNEEIRKKELECYKKYYNEVIEETFESLDVDEITYKAWVTVDRTSLETITMSTDDFIMTLTENLQQLKRHGFIARMQATYYRDAKEDLKLGELLLVCDFAENYFFALQDTAQSFHGNNMQATLHPFVTYHPLPVKEDTTTNLKCTSLDEYDKKERLLSARSEKRKTVPGAYQFHPNSRKLLAAFLV
eukprot:gene5762-11041_t